MSDIMIGLLSFPALLALIFLRLPISLAMFLSGLVGIMVMTGETTIAFGRLRSETYTTFSNYSLSIIPMFLLMGHFATLGGMSQALFRAATNWLGHRKGGVAMASVGACAGFGAICGSSLATAATMSRIALPELKRYGYSGGFSTATLAAGGTLGILIPPSVVLVIYAIITEQNIAKLFLAAFIPGTLAAIGYMIAISIYVRVNPGSVGLRERMSYIDRLQALAELWPVFSVFALVVGGIYLGWFTPTEGAAVGAFGTGLIAWFTGGLTWSTLTESFIVTAKSTAMIFFIILGAAFYNGFLALTQMPHAAAEWFSDSGLTPMMIMLIILMFYLIMGCFMDSLSMILLTIPIFWPIIQCLDFGLVSMVDLQGARLADLIANGKDIPTAVLSEARALLASGQELSREMTRELGLRGTTKGALSRANIEYTAIWFGILVLIITVGNATDLMDRFGNRTDLSAGLVIEMALLRVPKIVIDVLGFAVLAAAIGSFCRLIRTQELTVMRASGVSVWQILLPPVIVAVVIGIVTFAVISPISSALFKRHAYLEDEYLRRKSSVISLGPSGLWLRQQEPGGIYVLHAAETVGKSALVRGVQVLRFAPDGDRFVGRLDAATAQLMSGFWILRDVTQTKPGQPPERLASAELPTGMTLASLTESFAPWETISFWEMPGYAQSLADAGFPNERIRMQFLKFLAQPLLFAGLVVLA
ncbi:MAG: LptF/LptG family permease, partial [Rhodobacteraceae bacterium]|nr:LptF/LptG family permease [Paracoccaceae bacterium]